MITFAYTYYCNREMFKIHLENWNNYSPAAKKEIKFIIVDDGSRPPLLVRETVHPDLTLDVYRINEDLIWNVVGARNLAMLVADTEWVFQSDMDCVVTPDVADEIVKIYPTLNPGIRHYLGKRKGSDDSFMHRRERSAMILTKRGAIRAGLNDEDFVGSWGYEDMLAESEARNRGMAIAFLYDYNQKLTVKKYFTEQVPDANCFDDHKEASSGDHTNDNWDLCKYKSWKIINPSRSYLRFTWQHMQIFPQPESTVDKWTVNHPFVDPVTKKPVDHTKSNP